MTSSSTGAPSGRLATPYTKRQGLLALPTTSCSSADAASSPSRPTCSVNRGGVQNLVCLVHRSSFLTIKSTYCSVQLDESIGEHFGIRRRIPWRSTIRVDIQPLCKTGRGGDSDRFESNRIGGVEGRGTQGINLAGGVWRRSAFRPVRLPWPLPARARRAVSNPMPAIPPITTTVCPRSSSHGVLERG